MAPQANSLRDSIHASTQDPRTISLAGIPATAMPRRFVVEVYDPAGSMIAETNLSATHLDTVLRDIADGQYSGIVRVFELRDVSREIASAVADRVLDGNKLGRDGADFLEAYGFDITPTSEAA